MTPAHHSWLCSLFLRMAQPKPTETPSEWVEHNVQFNEPECAGPFSFNGREFLRDLVDDWGAQEVTDQTIVFATRMGKTRSIYGGAAYRLAHQAVRALYVKPSAIGVGSAQDDARNRFIPMLRATAPLAAMIPGGRDRHAFKTMSQRMGGSLVDWTGSNSVAALASNPYQIVIQDEVDKFNVTRRRDEQGNTVEADASDLADERTNECPTPKRVKSSTPTLAGGKIWAKLMQSDVRRYNIPCPHCDQPVIFAWNRDFTILPKTGREAYVKWEGKQPDGSWDEQQVKDTAHAECPHCRGKILDAHKGWMIREAWMRSKGRVPSIKSGLPGSAYGWVATQKGTPGHRGYHLPAMYGMHKASNFGEMAVRFLNEVRSLKGPHGFINSMLAEPFEAQMSIGKRTELIKSRLTEVNEWKQILYLDCQRVAPYFWFVVRAWGNKQSHGLRFGNCDNWRQVREVQLSPGLHIPDCGVFMDSGWGARSDADVYAACVEHCVEVPEHGRTSLLGWTPTKGYPGKKRWRHEDGIWRPWGMSPEDPFDHDLRRRGQFMLYVLNIASDYWKDILQGLREQRGGYVWGVEESMSTEEYWRHLSGQHKVTKRSYNGKTEDCWERRSKDWPDHGLACEYGQTAVANFLGLISAETYEPKRAIVNPQRTGAAVAA